MKPSPRPLLAVDLPVLAANLEHAVEAVDPERLPELAGLLESARVRIQARVVAGAVGKRQEPQEDRLLSVGKVAEKLNMSKDWVRDHQDDLGVMRLGSAIRFSSRRIERFIRTASRG